MDMDLALPTFRCILYFIRLSYIHFIFKYIVLCCNLNVINFSMEELRAAAEYCNERFLYKKQEIYFQVTKSFTTELKKIKSCF